jgi:hypothetical protein
MSIMKDKAVASRFITILLAIAVAFAFPVLAFADEPDSTSPTNPPASEQPAPQATPTNTATTNDQATVIADDEVPLSYKSFEYGWSLFNLLATVLTVVIAVILAFTLISSRAKNGKGSTKLGLSVFAFVAAILSIVLFAGTEPITVQGARMLIVDSYSVAHVSVLAVAILCAALSIRREDIKSLTLR